MANKIPVEVVYVASHGQAFIKPLDVEQPCMIKEAIDQSKILICCPEIDLHVMKVGVFSQLKTLEDLCKAGDRIEIYRPLMIDPKEARRKRAQQ